MASNEELNKGNREDPYLASLWALKSHVQSQGKSGVTLVSQMVESCFGTMSSG